MRIVNSLITTEETEENQFIELEINGQTIKLEEIGGQLYITGTAQIVVSLG